jgi:hypothetical protein
MVSNGGTTAVPAEMHDDVGVVSGRESWCTDWQRMPMEFSLALGWLLASGVELIDDEDVAGELLLCVALREDDDVVLLLF